MSITVHIPSTLRGECGGRAQLTLDASSVRETLKRLASDYPKVYRSVCDETGAVRIHIHLYVGRHLVRDERDFDAPMTDRAELFIMTAVSGG